MRSRIPLAKHPRKPAGSASRLAKFVPPALMEGEDGALYEELLAETCAAVSPLDFIEELYVADCISHEWVMLRVRRLHTSLIRATAREELEDVLPDVIDYGDLSNQDVAETLAETLQEHLPEDQGENYARKLARRYVCKKPDAIQEVDHLLKINNLDLDDILDKAKANKVEELTRAYARGEPDAIKQVNELLATDGLTIHDLIAKGLTNRIEGVARIDELERLDRIFAMAAARRDACLREINRRRAVLGEALRRKVQEIEAESFKVIETTSRDGKRAA
jgi:hypothetical protein